MVAITTYFRGISEMKGSWLAKPCAHVARKIIQHSTICSLKGKRGMLAGCSCLGSETQLSFRQSLGEEHSCYYYTMPNLSL